ncbi:hypothetical protein KM043_012769 [Ampulex compressa]|nr:hypothetical protein KM043_012769 [Ampulex compressa]
MAFCEPTATPRAIQPRSKGPRSRRALFIPLEEEPIYRRARPPDGRSFFSAIVHLGQPFRNAVRLCQAPLTRGPSTRIVRAPSALPTFSRPRESTPAEHHPRALSLSFYATPLSPMILFFLGARGLSTALPLRDLASGKVDVAQVC